MKKILVVAQFTQLPGEKGNNRSRFKLICEMLVKKGYEVTVATSRFRELDRTFRKVETDELNQAPYKIEILDEVGYFKNISLRRIYSMWTFKNSLREYLKNTKENYNLVYCCVPGLDSALIAGKYASKKNIPFLIDVQDVWPEVMYDLVLDIPVVSKTLFLPMQINANKVYAMADGIMAVSETYLDIAKKKNTKSKLNDYVFIGTDLEKFDNDINSSNFYNIEKPNDEFWIVYIGSLGHSYDIYTFIEGTKIAIEKGINVRPIILGSGPLEKDFKEYANKIGSNAFFTGWVDYATMGSYLKKSDAVINAIKRKAPQSITNKVGDYLSSGKPFLNGSQNLEFLDLLKEYKFGENYEPENPESLAKSIQKLFSYSKEKRAMMGESARKLAELKFDRKKTYPEIISMIDKLSK
ncbi:Glycosyltransferase involved in cell wall bisynthesis [Psychrobacillus psychrotolerans]|uniref:Glycosyltransferase involved in cell wall bisynthesis n=1 Tax=Psychrobacillus psychrotolerans TaxID=126156 RepID=A0A1I5Z654_9BACI|nr:glycosyltransferase family 4 protein [Psychrobacillus psychrotolerans]SFQ51597.1 Glycosyltransferase involved in cell wall bisynthesis [Psychrobacillus psychrotolerans]